MITQDFITEMKQALLDKKVKLENELAGLLAHTEMGDDDDDAAKELPVDEVNQDIIARITLDLRKIEKALSKIESGTYGTDDDGVEISEDRLRALPWADKAI